MVKFSKKQLSKKQRRKKQNATRKLKGGALLTDAQLNDKSIKELFEILADKQQQQTTGLLWKAHKNRPANIKLLVKKINQMSTSSPASLTEDAQLAAGPTAKPDQNKAALTEIRNFEAAGFFVKTFINNTFSYLMPGGGGGGGGGVGGDGGGGVGGDDGGGGGGISNDVVQCETSNDDSGINNEGRTTVMYNKNTKKISYMREGSKEELGVLNVVICGIDEKELRGPSVKEDETRKVFKVYFHTEGHIELDNTKFSIDITEDNTECKNFIQAMMERQNEILEKSHVEIKKVIEEPSTEGGLIRNRGFLKGDGDDDEFKVEE